MNLLINVAGHPAPWRFRGSARLDAWLASRPWLGAGGMRIVRVGGREGAEALLLGIRRAVSAYDDFATDVSVPVFGPSDLGGGLEAAISSALGVSLQQSRFVWTRGILHAQRGAPRVFVIDAVDHPSAEVRAWIHAARALMELLAKTAADNRMTIVVIDSARGQVDPEADDMSLGMPVDAVLANSESAATLWRAYVHLRVAWEAAGDACLAVRWSQQRLRAPPVGDEESFERALGTVARGAWEEVPPEAKEHALTYFEGIAASGRATGQLRELEQVLVAERLLWRPLGESVRPSPWVARAILAEGRCRPRAVPFLRGALLCLPLAHEILTRCFDVELRLRAVPLCRHDGGGADSCSGGGDAAPRRV